MSRFAKSLALSLVSVVAIWGLTGCAITDYCDNDACSQRMVALGVDDKALGCADASVIQGSPQAPLFDSNGVALTTQQIVDDTLAMWALGTRTGPSTSCQWNGTFGPPVSTGLAGNPTADEADSWERGFGPYAFIGEIQVFSPASIRGTYLGAGAKSLGLTCDPATGISYPAAGGGGGGGNADCGTGNGSGKTLICHVPPGNPDNKHTLCVGNAAVCAHLNNHEGDCIGGCGNCGGGGPPPGPLNGWQVLRLNNWFRCPPEGCTGEPPTGPFSFSCIATQVDGIEGGVEGQILGDAQTDPAGILSGLELDTIVLDTGANIGFGRNIRAITDRRQNRGYSVFVGVIGRGGEGRHEFVMPTAGLAEFLSGQEIEVHMPNNIPASFFLSGDVRENGMIEMTMHGMSYNGSSMRLTSPVYLAVDRNFRKWEIGRKGVDNDAAMRELAQWISNNIPLDQPWNVKGTIPELGVTLDDLWLQFDPVTIARFGNGGFNLQGGRDR